MPASPDFEQIARAALTDTTGAYDADRVGPVADALRQVWNDRGATDMARVESELSALMGATAAGPYCRSLDRALCRLDR
jgi:hypothetical protein